MTSNRVKIWQAQNFNRGAIPPEKIMKQVCCDNCGTVMLKVHVAGDVKIEVICRKCSKTNIKNIAA